MSAANGTATAGTEKEDLSHRQLPSPSVLAEAGDLTIKDSAGNTVPLKSLYADKPSSEQQLIIFIRHFFCGVRPHQNLSPLPQTQTDLSSSSTISPAKNTSAP